MLLRSILKCEVFGMGFLEKSLERGREMPFSRMEMAISFSTVLSLLVHVRELPEFTPLMARDRREWLRCLIWHGWLLGLGLAGERDPGSAGSQDSGASFRRLPT